MSLSELEALERERVIPSYARFPVEFVRGEGARLWDDEGNEYLDFLAGISVSSVGHCHPAVVAAVREQAGRLMHVTNLFYTEPPMRLAARLSERSLGGLRLHLDEEAKPGTLLSVIPSHASGVKHWVDVEVRYCRQTSDGWEAGCRFVKPPPFSVLMMFG